VEADPAPIDWGRLFAAGTERELEDLVTQRPEMAEPVKALTQLSADDRARIAAFGRECAVGGWNHIMNATREEGEPRGRAEGKADTLLAILVARGLSVSRVGVGTRLTFSSRRLTFSSRRGTLWWGRGAGADAKPAGAASDDSHLATPQRM
jgi:hypothetical protein